MKRILSALFALFLVQTTANAAESCWQTVTTDVFLWQCAATQLPAKGADDFALQLMVVKGKKSLLVFDAGSTAKVGEAAAKAIKDKFGAMPVWVVDTQPRPEHVMGNIGFARVYAPASQADFANRVLAGKQTSDLMGDRCTRCVEIVGEQIGKEAVVGTEPLKPLGVLSGKNGHFGYYDSDWVRWKYQLLPQLQSEQALVARNTDLGVYWVNSLVQPRRVPNLLDGDFLKQIAFLGKQVYDKKPPVYYVSSYGVLNPVWIKRNFDYFSGLQEQVYIAMERGDNEVEIIDAMTKALKVKYPDLTDKEVEVHQLNVQRVFHQIEDNNF